MSALKVLLLAASLPALIALIGCDNKDSGTTLDYCAPSADAGDDQSVTLGTAVVMNGSESGVGEGCEQHELTYQWNFESVPPGSAVNLTSLSDNNSVAAETPEFTPDLDGDYVASLVVCDEVECSSPDIVVITVSAGDSAPVADAGPDQSGTAGLRSTLDGSGSYDPDGDALTYAWSLTDIPTCSALSSESLYDSTTAAPSLVPDCAGTYQVMLVVSDGDQWSSPDYASIEVGSGNQLPIADAGDSLVVPPCEGNVVELDGTRSYDPEGEDLQYLWSVVARPASSAASDSSFDDASLSRPSFEWDIPGDYTFQLQVFDGESWSAPDVVTYSMTDSSENQRPVANAGDDQSVEVEAACTSDAYVFTCDDCASQTFTVDGSGSYDDDGDPITYFWSDPSGQATIESPNTAVTLVASPPLPAENDTPVTTVFNLTLTTADCELEDDDTVALSVICTGSD